MIKKMTDTKQVRNVTLIVSGNQKNIDLLGILNRSLVEHLQKNRMYDYGDCGDCGKFAITIKGKNYRFQFFGCAAEGNVGIVSSLDDEGSLKEFIIERGVKEEQA